MSWERARAAALLRECGGPCGSGGASERRTRSERRRQATAAKHASREQKRFAQAGRRNTKCPATNPSTPSTPLEKARPLASIGKSGVVAMRSRRERRLTILIVGALTTLLHPGWMVGQSHTKSASGGSSPHPWSAAPCAFAFSTACAAGRPSSCCCTTFSSTACRQTASWPIARYGRRCSSSTARSRSACFS